MQPVDIHRQVSVVPYSPKTELHFVPRSRSFLRGGRGVHEEWLAVRSDIGERDWASIDPAPVRVSKGVPHGRAIAGMWFWQRTRTHVWCESQTEKDEVMWLDHSGEVSRLWSQPFAIVFGHETALARRWHVPDFLALLSDGSYALLDVRPGELIKPDDTRKFDATASLCTTLGWGYRVLAGHHRRATQTLRWLSASRHDRCAPPEEAEARLLQLARGGASRRQLCLDVSPDCPPRACAWVDYLAWHRRLHVPLSDRFDSATTYTTIESR